MAVGKAAMQSSTVGQGSAQKAVDGSMLSVYFLINTVLFSCIGCAVQYLKLIDIICLQILNKIRHKFVL